MIPASAKQAAPAKVPQFTRPTLIASEVAGRTNAASPARKNRTDPTWLMAAIHQSSSPTSEADPALPHASIARCPDRRKQTQPRMSGSQIQPLDCRGVSPEAKAATRLTANSNVPTNSTTALRQCPRRRGRDHDREPAAEAEEPAADQVGEVDSEELGAGLGQEGSDREQRAAER